MKGIAALIALALPALANAAHPFVTEDPGTQGAGHYELELGFGAFDGDPSIPGRFSAFAPQLSTPCTPARASRTRAGTWTASRSR